MGHIFELPRGTGSGGRDLRGVVDCAATAIERADVIWRALRAFRDSKADFSDAVIVQAVLTSWVVRASSGLLGYRQESELRGSNPSGS